MNQVKKHWDTVKEEVQQVEIYSKSETVSLLKQDDYYKTLEGKARNRSLIKENKRLYKSIYEYTTQLQEAFELQSSWHGHYGFYKRVLFLVERGGDLGTLKCKCGKKYTWTTYCRQCPDYKRNQLGKPHSEEVKTKQRLAALSYIASLKGQVMPRYNRNSIELIEEYGREYGYSFMHAENGGEYFVKELGYFVDAYDPIHNAVLEIDERGHFDIKGNLKERDVIRQQQIEALLNCKFIRLKI